MFFTDDHTLTIAIILELAGIFLLVGDLFVPSHGLMTVAALACLGGGIYQAFRFNEIVGYISLLMTVVFLPVFAVVAVKFWPHTFVGRRIAPPNRRVNTDESPAFSHTLGNLVGQTGVALTPLRPVGTCDFAGRRVECSAQSGMIDRGAKIVAMAVQGQSLIVRPA